jgi:transcriptional regulator with XRE-family HTH domain
MERSSYVNESERRRRVMELLAHHAAGQQKDHPLKCKIYDLRKQNKWSLKDVAQLSGIPLNTVWRMERGYGATLRNAFKIASVFGATIYDLWSIPPSGSGLEPNEQTRLSVSELRQQRHWRLSDLAKLAGISKSTLFHIENGHTPTLGNAVKVAAALNVSVYHIWKPQQHQTQPSKKA